MLNLMSLRYGDSNGEITLENLIVLVLRMDCMASESKTLACCVLLQFKILCSIKNPKNNLRSKIDT